MAKTEIHRAIVQAHVWDMSSGRYVATDNVVETDIANLEGIDINIKRSSNRFLKGPIPWNWIIRASRLPGRALTLGLCLWRLEGATRKAAIPLSNSELEPFGIDRAAKSRGLAELEQAGLIKVARRRGRWPIVTLLK
jgi:DNA-binding transcriptional ArsR family regulator